MNDRTIERERTSADGGADDGEPRVTHIVAPQGGRPAQAVVMDGLLNGTPVTAICGKVWVPARDPKRYPLCGACVEVRRRLRPDQDPGGIQA